MATALCGAVAACSLQDLSDLGDGSGGAYGLTDNRDDAGAGGGTGGAQPIAGNGGAGGTGGTDPDIGAGAAGNLLLDPSFEQGHAGWIGFGVSQIVDVTTSPRSGQQCILSRNRLEVWQGPAFRVLNDVEPGKTYSFGAWLRTDGDVLGISLSTKVVCLEPVPDAGPALVETYTPTSSVGATAQWTELSGTFQVPECDLNEMQVYFEGPAPDAEFYVDDAWFVPVAP
jgi:hypothetical protein